MTILIRNIPNDSKSKCIEYLNSMKADLVEALDLDVECIDERATLCNYEFTDAAIYGEQMELVYTVSYSAYYGCKDQNYSSFAVRTVFAKIERNNLTFETHIPLPQRSTEEEF